MNERYWDDVEIGKRYETGKYTFTEEEILRFGRKYDPQIFHIDPEAAKHTIYGGLIASGWHTAAIWMKLTIEMLTPEKQAGGHSESVPAISPGFEDLRWLAPVRPGMTLTYSTEAVEKTELRSRPDLGLLKSRNEARDENGTVMFSFIGKVFMQRRPKET